MAELFSALKNERVYRTVYGDHARASRTGAEYHKLQGGDTSGLV
jgi:hypothetical protein